MKKFILSDEKIANSLINYIYNCDADELSRLAGEIFGGKCYPYPNKIDDIYSQEYEFIANENYTGEFNNV